MDITGHVVEEEDFGRPLVDWYTSTCISSICNSGFYHIALCRCIDVLVHRKKEQRAID